LDEEVYGVLSGGCLAKTSRGRPKKTWSEIVEKDCLVHGLKRKDAMDRIRWMKQIGDG